jgi:hypothetical protein
VPELATIRHGKGPSGNGRSNYAGYPVELVAWERLTEDQTLWPALHEGRVHIYPEACCQRSLC